MNALDTAIYSALTTGAGTAVTALLYGGTAGKAIYNTLAPQGAVPPYIVFNEMASTPRHHMGGTAGGIAWEDVQVQVQAVTLGDSMKAAGAISEAVDVVLRDAALTVSGHTLMYLRRVSGVSYAESVEGQRYNHRGSIYRVMLDPTT